MYRPLRLVARSAPLLVVVALLAGCGGHYVNRGADLFADGRYVEAAEVFERTQDRLTKSDSGEQARYGLYRGATLFVLGDFAHAQSWLAYAREVERVNPGALDSEDRAFLDRVWIALEARYRGLPPNTTNTAVAAAPPAPVPPATQAAPPSAAPAPKNQRSLVAPQ
jgi:hypothetical protein